MALHFEHAPIVEVVLDIRLRSALASLEPLPHLFDSELIAYPTKRNLLVATAALAFGDQISSATTQTLSGWTFESTDKTRTFQARLDGFSFHMLRPYTNWCDFSGEAKRLWSTYRTVVSMFDLGRVNLRYVNKIDIPTDGPLELKDYFRTMPELSPDITNPMANFFMRVQTVHDELQTTLTLTELLSPSTGSEVSVILDIDLARTEALPDSEEGMWALFDALRNLKNEIFLASITTRTKELIS